MYIVVVFCLCVGWIKIKSDAHIIFSIVNGSVGMSCTKQQTIKSKSKHFQNFNLLAYSNKEFLY